MSTIVTSSRQRPVSVSARSTASTASSIAKTAFSSDAISARTTRLAARLPLSRRTNVAANETASVAPSKVSASISALSTKGSNMVKGKENLSPMNGVASTRGVGMMSKGTRSGMTSSSTSAASTISSRLTRSTSASVSASSGTASSVQSTLRAGNTTLANRRALASDNSAQTSRIPVPKKSIISSSASSTSLSGSLSRSMGTRATRSTTAAVAAAATAAIMSPEAEAEVEDYSPIPSDESTDMHENSADLCASMDEQEDVEQDSASDLIQEAGEEEYQHDQSSMDVNQQSAIDSFFFPDEDVQNVNNSNSPSDSSNHNDSLPVTSLFAPIPTPYRAGSKSSRRFTRSMLRELEDETQQVEQTATSATDIDTVECATELVQEQSVEEDETNDQSTDDVLNSTLFTNVNFVHLGGDDEDQDDIAASTEIEVVNTPIKSKGSRSTTGTPTQTPATGRKSSAKRAKRTPKTKVYTPVANLLQFTPSKTQDDDESAGNGRRSSKTTPVKMTPLSASSSAALTPKSPDLGYLVDATLRRLANKQDMSDDNDDGTGNDNAQEVDDNNIKLSTFFNREDRGVVSPFADLSKQISMARQRIESITSKYNASCGADGADNDDDGLNTSAFRRRLSMKGENEDEVVADDDITSTVSEAESKGRSKNKKSKTIFLGKSMNSTSAVIARVILAVCVYVLLAKISNVLGFDAK